MALDTVEDYVEQARVLLMDQIEPFRYTDSELLAALNIAILEARRIRPDLFLTTFSSLPSYDAVDSTAVAIDEQYRTAFLFYIIGYAQLRDDEDVQDSRASAFLNQFMAKLQATGA